MNPYSDTASISWSHLVLTNYQVLYDKQFDGLAVLHIAWFLLEPIYAYLQFTSIIPQFWPSPYWGKSVQILRQNSLITIDFQAATTFDVGVVFGKNVEGPLKFIISHVGVDLLMITYVLYDRKC